MPLSQSTKTAARSSQGSAELAEPRPFGGCNQLLSHYKTIGRELLRSEGSRINYRYGSARIIREFQEGVAFVPVEVLESYLEDLLDRDASEESLFIARKGRGIHLRFLALTGVGFALATGLYCASSGASFYRSFALTVALVFPFAALWQLTPYAGLARRLGFAKIVSREISRRRGIDKDRSWNPAGFVFAEFLRSTGAESAKGAAFDLYQ